MFTLLLLFDVLHQKPKRERKTQLFRDMLLPLHITASMHLPYGLLHIIILFSGNFAVTLASLKLLGLIFITHWDLNIKRNYTCFLRGSIAVLLRSLCNVCCLKLNRFSWIALLFLLPQCFARIQLVFKQSQFQTFDTQLIVWYK